MDTAAIQEPGLLSFLSSPFLCATYMCNSEVTAPASKLTIEMICLPYHLPPSPLAPSQSGAKLTKGDKGEFYAYSVIPFAAAFVQSQEGGHQKSYTMPAHLSFFFPHLHCAAGKLYAIRLLDACSQKKGSFKL